MGREVRRVPADWQHPTVYRTGSVGMEKSLKPLYGGRGNAYRLRAEQWLADCIAWANGTAPDAAKHRADYPFFWEWDGMPPEPETYMPNWPDEECTHWQMYETTSEGTPISPVMDSPESLARWLADTGASSFANQTATYEQWLGMIRRGWAPSAVSIGGGPLISGVEAINS